MLNSLKNKGKKFWDIIKPRKWYGFLPIILVVGCVFIVSLAFVDVSFALDWDPVESFKNALISFVGGIFLLLATKFIALTVFCLRFTIEIAAYNNYIGSGAVQLGWVLVRDIANMFFVIILMLIAFGTVLGLEQYEWKKLLPKFILAAILVNFSRVICGVIIDAAHVFTMTFISGVAATAGGNLINALNLQSVLDFKPEAAPEAMSAMNILVTTIIACIFSFAALVIIGAYTLVFLARAVTLWVLIILSPLAFIFSIIPQTKSYATQWWSEFTKNVIIAPILAFFLWLSFAIAGSGGIHDEFKNNSVYEMKDMSEYQEAAGDGAVDSNISKFLEANNLAGFLIAFALLMAGIKVSQQLGTAGSGMLAKAGGAATQFAMAASGVTAAKWAGRGALKGAGKVGKFAAMKAPILGGDAWKRRSGRMAANVKGGIEKMALVKDKFAKGSREKILKKYGDKFGGKTLANITERILETPAKADARIGKLEKAAKGVREEREIVWGLGTTPEGKMEGAQKMKVEIEKEKADIQARNALSRVKVSLLRGRGMYEKADGLEASNEAENLESIQKMTKNMSSQQMSSNASNLSKERNAVLEKIESDGESNKLTEELSGINDRIHGLITSAADKGHYDYNIVLDEFSQNFEGDSQDHEKRLLTALLGKNTVVRGDDIATNKLTKEVNEEFEKMVGKKKDALLTHLREAGVKMATTEGELGLVSAVSYGRSLEDPGKLSGRQVVTLGIGSGVGEFDSEGVERAPGSRDVGKADQGVLDYFIPKTSLAKASGADALMNKDNSGNIIGWNETNLGAMVERATHATSPIELKRLFSLSVRNDINSDATTPEMKKDLFDKLSDGMDDRMLKEVVKIFDSLDVFTGEGKIKEKRTAKSLINKDSRGNATGWSADNLNAMIERAAQATSPVELEKEFTPSVRSLLKSNETTPKMKKELFNKLKNKLDDNMLKETANIIDSVKVFINEEKKADALMSKDNDGKIVGWSTDDFNAMIKQATKVIDPTEFKSQFSPTVRNRINSDEATPEMKKELFDKFKEKLDDKMMKEAVKTFDSLKIFMEEEKRKEKEKDRLDKSSGMEHGMIDL